MFTVVRTVLRFKPFWNGVEVGGLEGVPEVEALVVVLLGSCCVHGVGSTEAFW